MTFDPCPWRAKLQQRSPGWRRVTGPCLLTMRGGECLLCGHTAAKGAKRGQRALERYQELRDLDLRLERERERERIRDAEGIRRELLAWIANVSKEKRRPLPETWARHDRYMQLVGWISGAAQLSEAERIALDVALDPFEGAEERRAERAERAAAAERSRAVREDLELAPPIGATE